MLLLHETFCITSHMNVKKMNEMEGIMEFRKMGDKCHVVLFLNCLFC